MSLKNLYPAGLFSLPQVFSSTSCLLIVLSFNGLLQLFQPLSRRNVSREEVGVQGGAFIKNVHFHAKGLGGLKVSTGPCLPVE